MKMMFTFAALLPPLMFAFALIVIVAMIKARKKNSQNTPTVTPPPVAYTAPPAPVPTEQDRLKAEIAALSLEEVHRRYCDVAGRSDEYRYLCYEELERRKGK